VTHELTFADICNSVTEARVNALAGFGFTDRQRRFLVTVTGVIGCKSCSQGHLHRARSLHRAEQDGINLGSGAARAT
jgi:hypothetical protein